MCLTYLYKRWRRSREERGPDGVKLPRTYACQHHPEPVETPCSQCKAEQKAASRYRWRLIAGLFFPFALAALDATIIASALPWIANDFNAFSQLNWIVSAFNLTAAAFIPCWAQIADVFGRTTALNAATFLMMVGSALCTAAPTNAFPLLLLGRALQGIAAAGIQVLTRTILADKVSLKENAKNWAVFSLVGGTSYALGPVLGGYFAKTDYRWCFAINLPVGAVALVLMNFILRKDLLGPQPLPELDETTVSGRRSRFLARLKVIDYGGQILFLVGLCLFILALTWGGATYLWQSAAVLVSLIVGIVLIIGFAVYERGFGEGRIVARWFPRQRAMIPWNLIASRDVGLLFYTECASGMGMFAVLYFCNIYFTAVQGFSADKAGAQLLYFTPGLGAGVISCALLTGKFPRTTFHPIVLGTVTETVGIACLAYACYNGSLSQVFGFMALVGYGCGLRFMAAPLHVIGLFRQHRAAVLALFSLTIPLGGTIGLTIMSTVFNNVRGADVEGTHGIDAADVDARVHSAKMGVVWAFVSIVPFAFIALLCSLCLGNIKLGQGTGDQEDGGDNIVMRDIYLLALFRRRGEEQTYANIKEHDIKTQDLERAESDVGRQAVQVKESIGLKDMSKM